MDQGSTMKRSAVHNFAPTVTKFCVMWEGQALPHDTKFGNSRCEIVGRRVIFIWSLIHGLRWSGLIKAEPDEGFCHHYHVIVWGKMRALLFTWNPKTSLIQIRLHDNMISVTCAIIDETGGRGLMAYPFEIKDMRSFVLKTWLLCPNVKVLVVSMLMTRWSRLTHISVSELGHHWIR